MTLSKLQKEFIETIGRLAVIENSKRKNKIMPSVCIAQACLETGYGQSQLMKKGNAFFGIKANSSWKGKVYNSKTKECYDGINYVSIVDTFRAYDNMADSVKDYYDLLSNARYKNCNNLTDARATITAIKNSGYATDPSYINKVMLIINSGELTRFDGVASVTPDTIEVYDKVEILNTIKNGLKEYGTTYEGNSFRLYYKTYDVISVTGQRVVIGQGKTVTTAIHIKNLRKVKL